MKYLKILGIDLLVGLVVYMFLNYFSYIFFGVNLINEFGFDCLVGWFLGIFFGWGVVTLYFVSKDVRYLKNKYKQLYLEECEKNKVLKEEMCRYIERFSPLESKERLEKQKLIAEPKRAYLSVAAMFHGETYYRCGECGDTFECWSNRSGRCRKCGAIFIK